MLTKARQQFKMYKDLKDKESIMVLVRLAMTQIETVQVQAENLKNLIPDDRIPQPEEENAQK